MPVPGMLTARKKGNLVWSGSPSAETGCSMLGTKTLAFSDAPAIYLHDTGGFLGTEALHSVDKKKPIICCGYIAGGQTFFVWARFSPTHHATWLLPLANKTAQKQVKKVIQKVLAPLVRSHGGADLVSDVPLCVHFPGLPGVNPYEPGRFPAGIGASADEWELMMTLPYAEGVEEDIVLLEEWPLFVRVMDNRLMLDRLPNSETVVDISLRGLAVERNGVRVRVEQSVLLGDCQVPWFEVICPDEDSAAALVDQLGPSGGPEADDGDEGETELPKGLSATVTLSGWLVPGESVSQVKADAILGDDRLLLRERDGSPLHSFMLTHSGTSIQGSHETFVVADSERGPLIIACKSTHFHKHLSATPAVREAARRTASEGPFVGFSRSGAPLSVRVSEQAVTFAGPDGFPALPLSEVRDLSWQASEELAPTVLTIGGAGDSREVLAELDVLQGLAARIRAAVTLDRLGGRVSQLVGAVLELEGKMLLHAAFGPIASVQAQALSKWAGADQIPWSNFNPSAADDATLAAVLDFFVGALEPLRAYLDTTIYYLPAHLVTQDRTFAEAADMGIPDLSKYERQYARVLSQVAPLSGQMSRMEAALNRSETVRKALSRSRPGWGGLAVSLGASLVNPFFLIGAAQQGLGLVTASGKAGAAERESVAMAVGEAIRIWQNMITRLLPPVSHRVIEGLFDLRVSWARDLERSYDGGSADHQRAIVKALCLRFGRLESHLDFPDEPRGKPRRALAGLLESWQREAEDPGLASF